MAAADAPARDTHQQCVACNAVQDICKPEAPRLRRHLSAIVNFTRYREDKLACYIEQQDQLADVMDEATQAASKRNELVRAHAICGCETRFSQLSRPSCLSTLAPAARCLSW